MFFLFSTQILPKPLWTNLPVVKELVLDGGVFETEAVLAASASGWLCISYKSNIFNTNFSGTARLTLQFSKRKKMSCVTIFLYKYIPLMIGLSI